MSCTLMVHHIVLYKLKPEVTPARVEDMMMNARMQFLAQIKPRSRSIHSNAPAYGHLSC